MDISLEAEFPEQGSRERCWRLKGQQSINIGKSAGCVHNQQLGGVLKSRKPADRLGRSCRWANEVGGAEAGGGERKRGGPKNCEHIWFLECCDASDVIDAE